MAVKSEIFPITLQLKPDSSLNLKSGNVKINLEKSSIEIYNDRGGRITDTSDKDRLFVDNNNLIIGYLWDTGKLNEDSRFNIQDYYLFTFLVAIDYIVTEDQIQSDGTTSTVIVSTNTFILSYSTKKLLEAQAAYSVTQ